MPSALGLVTKHLHTLQHSPPPTDSNLLQKVVPKIGVRADYSLLQLAALVTKLGSWGQVQATVGAQKKVLAIIVKRGWGGWSIGISRSKQIPPVPP